MNQINQNWQKIELNEILSISSKKFNPIGNNENKKCVELEHLSQETGKLLGYTNSSEQQSIKNSFEEGQILFGKLRPYLKKFWKAKFEGVCSSEIWVMSGKKVKNDFLFYLVQTEKFNQIANVSSGSKMPRADWNYMSEIPFDIPPIKEQTKIAEILTTWDEAITKQTELLRAKELLKIALMQKLLSGEVRFNGFNDEWEIFSLNEVLKERKTYQSKGLELEHVSLTKEGVVPKSERYERDFLVKGEDKQYKITKLNDICYNPANLKFGVICKNTYGDGIFSPIYVTFETKKGFNIDFLGYFLTWSDFINKVRRFEEGTVYERMAVNPKDFLSFKTKLPLLPEQQKIAEVLSLADDEINLLKNELEELKQQKKALMQKLLTGQVRVKV
ncbi:restriction endonuclease subunit S [Aliarcobacter butzleri]|uniref:restriction endonuclease subunit S n=1 Tax=Aliarcobacter butzleri TaxID=28197 RepID=UPI003AF82E1F